MTYCDCLIDGEDCGIKEPIDLNNCYVQLYYSKNCNKVRVGLYFREEKKRPGGKQFYKEHFANKLELVKKLIEDAVRVTPSIIEKDSGTIIIAVDVSCLPEEIDSLGTNNKSNYPIEEINVESVKMIARKMAHIALLAVQ
ncbi:MAG: hypothetical protein IJS15_13380 [Victivallales bacterium]|nr:hypothetical protein [Victivallales bacterium]